MTKQSRLEIGSHQDAVDAREQAIEQTKLEAAEAGKFPLKIKEFRGKGLVPGFFPWSGVKVKPGEIFYAKTREEARAFIDSGLVELVLDERDPLGEVRE